MKKFDDVRRFWQGYGKAAKNTAFEVDVAGEEKSGRMRITSMAYGKVHFYTGDGKGKTTAAFGLGLRACGCGAKVVCVQFLKTGRSGEVEAVNVLKNFSVYRFETEHGFFWDMDASAREALLRQVQDAFAFCLRQVREHACDVLIMDEIFGALLDGLVTKEQLVELLTVSENTVELVLTGRNAPQELYDLADYITRLEPVKHPYEKGILARPGIEY